MQAPARRAAVNLVKGRSRGKQVRAATQRRDPSAGFSFGSSTAVKNPSAVLNLRVPDPFVVVV